MFSHTDDYINLSEVVREYPNISEIAIESKEHYLKLLNASKKEVMTIPLFLKDNNGEIHIISSYSDEMEVEIGNTLMYLGKKIID